MFKATAFWDIGHTASIIATIAVMMEAVRTSETAVHFDETTRRYTPEACNLHTRHLETSLVLVSLSCSANNYI
jgi:hypothetical protein